MLIITLMLLYYIPPTGIEPVILRFTARADTFTTRWDFLLYFFLLIFYIWEFIPPTGFEPV